MIVVGLEPLTVGTTLTRKFVPKIALYPGGWHHSCARELVRYGEAKENMQRIRFVLLVLLAAMLEALISMVDSTPGWDDMGVSTVMVLGASALMGALHPHRAWVCALAVGSWIPALSITLGHSYAPLAALAFALVGAYAAEAFAGRRLEREADNAE
jgi:hypothetical protein